jgi:16S rRNA (adenine1518-N6/adenine1519-N6)-dimethyltransferase
MHNLKKRLGQHFLHDKNIIKKIINSVKPNIKDTFLEIGPGDGVLSIPLQNKVSKLVVIEKDKDLIPVLSKLFQDKKNVQIIHEDILKIELLNLFNKKMRIIGNLPYNISTEIIFKLIPLNNIIEDIHFMLQKEVVERIIAKPSNKTYGRLSVMAQTYYDVKKLFDISPNVFTPKPKVYSSYLKMCPKIKIFEDEKHENVFSKIVKIAFTSRRKMLKTSLKNKIDIDIFNMLSIDPCSRPEELSSKNFIEVSKYV